MKTKTISHNIKQQQIIKPDNRALKLEGIYYDLGNHISIHHTFQFDLQIVSQARVPMTETGPIGTCFADINQFGISSESLHFPTFYKMDME